MNIKFNYLYRDASNYKKFGYGVFSNPGNLALSEIETRIRAALIDGEFFDPVKWNIPQLRFDDWSEDDHTWNEFEGVEETNEGLNMKDTIAGFLGNVECKTQA